jgi:catechol 2,3-dioxygenase-like lactoylglutathione lyase family enzyme
MALPLRALNHISWLVKDVKESATFYESILGFVRIKRPESFEFEGAW